ncbi:polysaccharide pyruvyl transferase family protein [Falsiroseomonas tokyonensis]|uniref:Polysaccharide pyruvyl transferase family protein n=1 Tax=Falsiroseomonas tokyonensis TaxID=430521 RepID=A0ABV7BSU5_9PROT|nr:polysaccharide pyruvyl transferase family protein [Falsiroseomonas tokyonensis]MBU8538102.1 polysaccharide pyruvyl transferase family protein [Falsiroseomonas tokyonensis]
MTEGAGVIGTGTIYRPFRPDNTGNILHAVAARRLLQNHTDLPTTRLWSEKETEKARSMTHIVVVMANAIRLGETEGGLSAHHDIMAQNLARTNQPVVVFGLGAQAAAGREVAMTMPEPTLRLLRIIADRSQRIAVRGAFTAEVLEKFGIKKAAVLGCQSCFISLTPKFPHALNRPLKQGSRVAFNYTSISREAPLVKWAVEQELDMVGQQEGYEELLKADQPPPADAKMERFYSTQGIPAETYAAYCRTHFHKFFEQDSWLAHMARYDFSTGSRFHGNMAALQAGVPALWMTHDRRTQELCELLKLPSMPLEDAIRIRDLATLRAAADYSGFLSAYPARYAQFKAYLDESGLPHRLA